MSVVIAIKKDNVVYMAADTMITYGDSKRHLYSDSSQKVWAVSDTPNCIMGGTGYLRDINLIHHCTNELVPEAAIIREDLNIGIIMTYTVPTIFETIRNYTKVVMPENQPFEFCSSFLYAYKNRLFSILQDGLVEEIDDYTAIGSGADAALASLKHSVDEPVYTRLIKALEAASDISLYVSAPYVCINTKDTTLYDLCLGDGENKDNEDNAHESSAVEEEN